MKEQIHFFFTDLHLKSFGITTTWIVRDPAIRSAQSLCPFQYGARAEQFSSALESSPIANQYGKTGEHIPHHCAKWHRILSYAESEVVYAFKHLQNIKRGGLDRIGCSFPMHFPCVSHAFPMHFPSISPYRLLLAFHHGVQFLLTLSLQGLNLLQWPQMMRFSSEKTSSYVILYMITCIYM